MLRYRPKFLTSKLGLASGFTGDWGLLDLAPLMHVIAERNNK